MAERELTIIYLIGAAITFVIVLSITGYNRLSDNDGEDEPVSISVLLSAVLTIPAILAAFGWPFFVAGGLIILIVGGCSWLLMYPARLVYRMRRRHEDKSDG